jgi:hypothetical protein
MSRRERDLRRLARERGWILEPTSRHWRLRHPSGEVVIAPKTPGCWRSDTNLLAALARVERGLEGQ